MPGDGRRAFAGQVASCTRVQDYRCRVDTIMNNGPDGLGWTSVETCTLLTVERPLRLAEFDDLFDTTLQSVERTDPTRARLLLTGDEAVAERTQRLADAESSCCSFFTFCVSTVEPGLVAFDIEVPATYADVLAAMLTRADAALRTGS
jgi:hypothetical protein